MKVAVIVNELNIRGGTHKQVLRLCEYLQKKGIQLSLITRFYEPEKTYKGFENYDLRYLYKEYPSLYTDTGAVAKLKRLALRDKEDDRLYELIPKDADIINVHDNFLDGIIRRAKRDGKPVVWQINDLDPMFGVGVSDISTKSIKNMIKRSIYLNNIKDVDRITVNVSKNAERVKQCFGRDAKVYYCGVDINEKLSKHSYRDTEVFRLLGMGVFFPYRNYETLVEVVRILKKDGKNVRLDLAGSTEQDKEYSAKISRMISEYGLENEVKIWGQVDDETYNRLFNDADTFAFINIEQSWGLAVFEAMSAGLPTIVSCSVGATELLHDGTDAVIVDPKDPVQIKEVVEILMADRDYYDSLSDNAYNIVKEYSWDKLYSAGILELFEQMTEKGIE